MNIKDLHNWQLLQLYTDIHEELQQRNVIRTSNLVGDYTEYLVASAFSLALVPNSSAGYDATDAKHDRYQIKGRRLTKHNKLPQMSDISGLETHSFDWIVGVLFTANFMVSKACMIPYQTTLKIATKKKRNKHILILRDAVWGFEGVLDITQDMINHQNELNEIVQPLKQMPEPELQVS